MVFVFAIIGAIVAFFPGASFILIPMEVFLIYKIARRHNAFDFPIFIVMMAALMPISGFLKGLATFLQVIPVIGQIANSLVAFGFIIAVGLLAEQFYANRSKA
jgi:hypothetical protein